MLHLGDKNTISRVGKHFELAQMFLNWLLSEVQWAIELLVRISSFPWYKLPGVSLMSSISFAGIQLYNQPRVRETTYCYGESR